MKYAYKEYFVPKLFAKNLLLCTKSPKTNYVLNEYSLRKIDLSPKTITKSSNLSHLL